MIWIPVSLAIVVLGLFLYWALVITEGVYLGPRVVALLYDWTPRYYDRIKAITWQRDDECIVMPMLEWLGEITASKQLEKATISVLKEGKIKTPDLGGKNTTKEIAEEIISKL